MVILELIVMMIAVMIMHTRDQHINAEIEFIAIDEIRS